jgi:hypothetical protein
MVPVLHIFPQYRTLCYLQAALARMQPNLLDNVQVSLTPFGESSLMNVRSVSAVPAA